MAVVTTVIHQPSTAVTAIAAATTAGVAPSMKPSRVAEPSSGRGGDPASHRAPVRATTAPAAVRNVGIDTSRPDRIGSVKRAMVTAATAAAARPSQRAVVAALRSATTAGFHAETRITSPAANPVISRLLSVPLRQTTIPMLHAAGRPFGSRR